MPLPPVGPVSKVLLQVDLEGHSRWMATKSSVADATKERIQLAEVLHAELAIAGFALLSWKGDGGVYSVDPTTTSVDVAVEAAQSAASAFAKWRLAKEDRAYLRMRISAHWAPDLYTHKERGYWSSDHLNLFLKYEREIGLSGSLAVTNVLFRHLSEQMQRRFTFRRPRALGLRPGEALIQEVHYLPLGDEVHLNNQGKGGFIDWLSDVGAPVFNESDQSVGPRSCVRGSVGDAALLFSAPVPGSPMTVDLVPASNPPNLQLPHHLEERWRELQATELAACREQLREDRKKVSPVSLIRPLTDIPLVTLEWRTELWSRARSFHQLLKEHQEVWGDHAARVLAMQEEPLAMPGIVCCHFVVRTGPVDSPAVLLCQRQYKGHKGMYHPGRWSISFEEQLRPGESVQEAIQRGLNEELLGALGTVGTRASIVAAFIEKSILNLSLLVLVDTPHSLDAIVKFWQRVPDKDEHRQLASLSLDRAVLSQLAATQTLSPPVRERIRPGHPEVFVHDCGEQRATWSLHPTSLARAAAALWVQEVGGAPAV